MALPHRPSPSPSLSFPSAPVSPRPFSASGPHPTVRPAPLCRAESGDGEKELFGGFGYTRLDAIILGAGLIALGYVLYYGLQAAGMDAGMAGNWVQLIIFLGICIGWVSTYIWRVANKQMTYVKQLEDYEEAVMKKRLEEMPEAEYEKMMAEIEKEKEDIAASRKGKAF